MNTYAWRQVIPHSMHAKKHPMSIAPRVLDMFSPPRTLAEGRLDDADIEVR